MRARDASSSTGRQPVAIFATCSRYGVARPSASAAWWVPSSKRYARGRVLPEVDDGREPVQTVSVSMTPAPASTVRPRNVKFGTAQRRTGSIWLANAWPARPISSAASRR